MQRRPVAYVICAWATSLCLVACTTSTDASIAPIDDTPGAVQWKDAAANSYNSCALTIEGAVYCMGLREPQCSPGPCADFAPTPLNTTLRFSQLVLGEHKRCAISTAQQLYCWGSSYAGVTLGDGATDTSAAPILIPLPSEPRAVAAGYEHSCGLGVDGTAYCWGGGSFELGDGSDSLGYRRIKTPTLVATSLKFNSISAGTTQTCAIGVDAFAYCWGSGYGTLGIGARDTACVFGPSCYFAPTPQLVAGGHTWKAVSAGNTFTCGLTTDDKAYCWGAVGLLYPGFGVLGNGTFEGSKSPVPVAGELLFHAITAGVRHACGLTADGEAYCWGNNESAELGIGRKGGRYNTPQKVSGGLRFTAIDAGNATCAVSTNRNLYCWGQRLGTVGVLLLPTRMEPAP